MTRIFARRFACAKSLAPLAKSPPGRYHRRRRALARNRPANSQVSPFALYFDPRRSSRTRLRRRAAWPASPPTAGSMSPKTYPPSRAATSPPSPALPYDAAAARLIEPFAGEIGAGVLREATRAAYAGFSHRAVAPLTQIDDNLFVLELFHGPTLAFKDLAMQLLGRLMNHVLEQRGLARHDRRRDLGRHGRRRDRGVSRTEPGRRVHPLSRRARLRRAAPADDHGRGRQYPRHRLAGHVRRRAVDSQKPVSRQRLSASASVSRASIRSTGRGSSRRWSIISPAPSRLARRFARSPSPCRPAISATCWRAMWRSAWACRCRG